MDFVRCDAYLVDSPELSHSDSWSARDVVKQQTTNSGNAGISFEVGSEAGESKGLRGTIKGTGAAKRDQEFSTNASQEFLRDRTDWSVVASNKLHLGKVGQVLEGKIIADATLWRVLPRSMSERSGVLARIVVRADWVRFENVRHIKPSKRIRGLRELLQGPDSVRHSRFMVLLRHLTIAGLQRANESREATLAMSAVVVKPSADEILTPPLENEAPNIEIPLKPIQDFLESESGYEAAILLGCGVPANLIPTPEIAENSGPRVRRLIFVPQSGPEKAVLAFEKIQSDPGNLRNFLDAEVGRNEIRDLRALGLVKSSKGKYYVSNEGFIEPELALRRAASIAPSIKVARAMLLSNPKATAVEIADAVSIEIGALWNAKGSKQRHGNALRLWTIWVEPHLIDPRDHPEMARIGTGGSRGLKSGGAPRKLTPAMRQVIENMFASGATVAEVARKVGVSKQAVYHWKKQLGI